MKAKVPYIIRVNQIVREAKSKIRLETGLDVDLKVIHMGNTMSVQELTSTVAIALEVSLESMLSAKRYLPIREARQIAMFLCRKYLKNASYSYLAGEFNRDHSTVIHSIRVVNNMIETMDEEFLIKLNKAEQAVITKLHEIEDNQHTA